MNARQLAVWIAFHKDLADAAVKKALDEAHQDDDDGWPPVGWGAGPFEGPHGRYMH
jgi:hypothetical protein